MLSFIRSRISVKVALLVNTILLVVIIAGAFILISKQSKSLEAELLNKGKIQAILGAKMIGKIIEEAIDNGVITVGDAFDEEYEPIGNFDPPKYHTKYDFYLDKSILGIQDEFLLDKSLVFAAAVDRNGYVPTHNSKFQQPITGDPKKDKTGNRTKQIFNDKIGIAAAKNKEKGFLQVYYRDTGETMWDISSPIIVKGKHWGGFRVGLSLVAIDKAKRQLIITLASIMSVILLISLSATFILLNRALLPLRKLTDIAVDLSKAKNLDEKIYVSRKDEIGELQSVLERLRLSMILVLKKNKKQP